MPTLYDLKPGFQRVLMAHGEAAMRLPRSQGYEYHHALEREGVTAQMVVYPGSRTTAAFDEGEDGHRGGAFKRRDARGLDRNASGDG